MHRSIEVNQESMKEELRQREASLERSDRKPGSQEGVVHLLANPTGGDQALWS